jgi:hypothetical protein
VGDGLGVCVGVWVVGVGEDEACKEGLELFWTMKADTIIITTKITASTTIFLCRLKACILC